MKTINISESVKIPENVKISVDGKKITVTGPRGTLKRDFAHVSYDMYIADDAKRLVVESWMATRRVNAGVRTTASHIQNMITGVTKGYKYKMRFVYAHFPVNVSISGDKKTVEVRNFLGEKRLRSITMKEGTQVDFTGQKDEIAIVGNDLESVSQSAAAIHMATLVRGHDIRKFLDGIYVSERGNVIED